MEKASEKGDEKEEMQTERQKSSSEKKALRNFSIVVFLIFASFGATLLVINMSKHFSFNGVSFYADNNAVKGSTIYRTSLPGTYTDRDTGKVTSMNYDFYFRNDPRELNASVPIEGEISFMNNIVIDSSANYFSCGGNGILALAEFSTNMKPFVSNISTHNESANYVVPEDTMFIRFVTGNSTEIRATGNNVYEIAVNNCEILPAMERLSVERILQYKRG